MGKTALRLHQQVHRLEAEILRKQDRMAMLNDQIDKLEQKRTGTARTVNSDPIEHQNINRFFAAAPR